MWSIGGVYDGNSKRRILTACRVNVAKRTTDKAVFQSFGQFEGIYMAWIWRFVTA